MTHALSEVLHDQHLTCDAAILRVSKQVDRQAWANARRDWRGVRRALEAHIDAEEGIVFPEFEAATRMTEGPTSVMRSEHRLLRELLDACNTSLLNEESRSTVDALGRLQALLAQHNQKEEGILYPWCDRVLGPRGDAVVADVERRFGGHS